ncbi:MAG: hypothetical protein AcusKO_02050 [Acuticoccus sp.]
MLGDQGSSSIAGSDKIYLLVDTNGDGDAADEGERIVFFDETNAEGLGGEGTPTGNILNIGQASSDLAVYAGDGDTDAVYRLKDLNGDGDANDAGESSLWFSEADNAAGFTLPTPNGIAEGPDGAIYIVNAGVSSRPADAIYRTEDLNGDGDANDEGEATVWLDLTAEVPTSSPYDLFFIGDRGYLIDPSGSAEDSIYTFADTDGSGAIESDEFATFATKTETGAPIDFTAAADGGSVVVWEWLDRDTGVYSVVRLTDLDGSGAIDQPDETVEIWNTDYLPDVFDTFAGFSIAADGEGRIAVTSNDSGAFGDNVYILDDLNGDGDYFDAGEANVLASRAFDETTLERPRSLEFYDGAVQNADVVASAGNHFSLFLDSATNTVYASGENVLGQLGQGVTGFDIKEPVPVAMPEGFDGTIVSVAAGMIHGSLLTEDGDVYVWGYGNFGRLGLGDEESRLVATKLDALADERVVVIDNGNGVSFAITENGTLYGWGQNTSGQLGQGDEDERLVPAEIDIPGQVIAVSSGTSHTLALTADGDVYGFGSNVDGQVGDPTALEEDGDPVREILSPVKVEGLPADIVAVTADTQTSFAVSADGTLYGWGENSFGQLLIGTDNGDGTFEPTDDKVLSPVEIAVPGDVVDVKAGARWVAALNDDGEIYMWGPNDEGPSGGLDGDPASESTGTFFPVKLEGLDDVEIVDIQTGPNHLIAVAADGTVHTFGSNADGRLGYSTEGSTYTPAVVEIGGDIAPYLLSAEPADNGRDVAPGAAVVLTFTENVVAGEGEIRFVDRDTGAVLAVDVADPYLVSSDGAEVTVFATDFFTPDGRYAVEIDDGAFEDVSGQPFEGIATGDTSTFNFYVADIPVGDLVLAGTADGELLRGASGDDDVAAAGGDDKVFLNGGDDTASGGGGDDTIEGGAGADEIRGNAGDDSLSGGTGRDSMSGAGGSDTIEGDRGDDFILGGADDDVLSGDGGEDWLQGGNGNDLLDGGARDDALRGGHGDDTLAGGNGDDLLLGNAGEDVFVFDTDDGGDVVRGFTSGEDAILLEGGGAYSLTFDAGSGNTTLEYGATTVEVRGVELTSSDIAVVATTDADLFVV